MKLKAVNLSPGANFLPELSDSGDYWIAEKALTEGSPEIEVSDRIGSRLVGAYPENFEIIDSGSKKKVTEEASSSEESFSEAEEGEEKPAPSSKKDLKNKMAEKYSKNASVEE